MSTKKSKLMRCNASSAAKRINKSLQHNLYSQSRLGESKHAAKAAAKEKYLEEHGSKEAMPAVEPLLEHQDSIIRHSARSAYNALQNRAY